VRAYDAGFAARGKLFTGGDILTAATGRLVEGIRAGGDAALSDAAERVDSAMLLVEVANWRFLAAMDPQGPASFQTNAEKATAALADLERVGGEAVGALTKPVRDASLAYETNFTAASTSLLEGADRLDNAEIPLIDAMRQDVDAALVSLKLGLETNAADSERDANQAMRRQFIMAGIVVAIGSLVAMVIGRGIVRPIANLTAAMARLAEGHHDVAVPSLEQTDEIGAMARAVDVFKQNAIGNRRLTDETAKE
jgi:methyl-accepting chemotaxis protein